MCLLMDRLKNVFRIGDTMENERKRKTDRRTLYTRSAIKDAVLRLVETTPFDRINVTAVCREADIARATFYLHFDGMEDVLDSIIDDALLFSEGSDGTVSDALDVLRRGDGGEIRRNEAILPACQRMADSDKYHRLFMDASVGDRIIRRIADHERGKVVPEFMERFGLAEDEADMLFRFILHGTFAVNRSLGWEKNERWYRYQEILGRFIDGGCRE